MSYLGHKNWNHWNVSLWLFNEESLYRLTQNLLSRNTKDEAARLLLSQLPSHTPDGAPYTFSSIRAALVGE